MELFHSHFSESQKQGFGNFPFSLTERPHLAPPYGLRYGGKHPYRQLKPHMIIHHSSHIGVAVQVEPTAPPIGHSIRG